MTKIGFDSQPFGVPATDDHRADVCGPGAGYAVPLMMGRKFIGQTSSKVVRLANICRIPATVSPLGTEDINAADLIEGNSPDCKVLKFVGSPVQAGPN